MNVGMARLAQAVQEQPDKSNLRVGTVTQSDAAAFLVDVAGGTVRPGLLNGIQPSLGSTVALLRQDSTWLCLGQIFSEPADASGGFGLICDVADNNNSAAIANGAPQIVLTTPNFLIIPGRAYEVEWGNRFASSATTSVAQFEPLIGGTLVAQQRYPTQSTLAGSNGYGKGYFRRAPGGAITSVVAELRLTSMVAATTVTQQGSNNAVRWLSIADIGPYHKAIKGITL
jgi:hypothetical protein